MPRIVTSALLLCCVPAAALAQVLAGGEFRVNAYTTRHQEMPAVAMEPDGDFIVVWSGIGPTGDGDIFGQRYDASGAPRGGEFLVNSYTTGVQTFVDGHDVAVAPDGRFVVVWSIYPEPQGDRRGVFGRRFDGAGNPIGEDFHVNTFTTGNQTQPQHGPRVAMADGGTFVVVWDALDGDNYGVLARRYDAAGAPMGAEFVVNTYTIGRQLGSEIDMAPDGTFVVAWLSDGQDGSSFGVFGQRFDSGGARIGGEFQVNTFTTGPQGYLGYWAPKVAMAADGRFTVVWSDAGAQPPPGNDVFGQRFDASGARAGAEFRLNESTVTNHLLPALATDALGNLVATWTEDDGGGIFGGIFGRRWDRSGAPRGPAFLVNSYTTDMQFFPRIGSDDVGNFVVAWTSYGQVGDGTSYGDVFAQRFGGLRPQALAVDSAGNRVLEPGETAEVRPTWRNVNGAALTFGGVLTEISGPAGPTYAITDGAANYGTVVNSASGACTDCYAVTVSGTRPATHWDASAVETITPDALGQQKKWILHVGGSFGDVSTVSPFYRFIETLLHLGVTAGCSATAYCPAAATTREQMAVFVLRAKEGASYLPPACGTPLFADVPAISPFCRFIEELARRGVVTGCGGGNYCPTADVSREQMAVFVLRTLDPALDPPACTTPVFNDVPASSAFCRWIEELARRGVVTGCAPALYCPTSPVTREQMGVFLTATFGLTLYGP